MPAPAQILGQQAEQQAKNYLKSLGYRFIAQNYRLQSGEIDLIFIDHDELVFIEVKYRTHSELETALAAVTPQKLSRLLKTAQHFMQTFPNLPQSGRIDVVAFDPNRTPVLEHVKNITME